MDELRLYVLEAESVLLYYTVLSKNLRSSGLHEHSTSVMLMSL